MSDKCINCDYEGSDFLALLSSPTPVIDYMSGVKFIDVYTIGCPKCRTVQTRKVNLEKTSDGVKIWN